MAGKAGQAHDAADRALVYECAGNFRPDEGTAAFWVEPEWRGDNPGIYCTLFGAANWGMVYKYQDQISVTFAAALLPPPSPRGTCTTTAGRATSAPGVRGSGTMPRSRGLGSRTSAGCTLTASSKAAHPSRSVTM